MADIFFFFFVWNIILDALAARRQMIYWGDSNSTQNYADFVILWSFFLKFFIRFYPLQLQRRPENEITWPINVKAIKANVFFFGPKRKRAATTMENPINSVLQLVNWIIDEQFGAISPEILLELFFSPSSRLACSCVLFSALDTIWRIIKKTY